MMGGREHRARSRTLNTPLFSTKYIGSLTIGVNQHILAGGAPHVTYRSHACEHELKKPKRSGSGPSTMIV